MKVVEDFESRPHKVVTFVIERRNERQEWSEQRMPQALPGCSGGRLPGRSAEDKVENKEKRTGGQGPMRRWDCSQIENEEWQERDQMAAQWEEEQNMEEIVERRRMEGRSLQLDAMERVLGLVVNERMLQDQRVRNLKEKENTRMVH